MSTKTYVLYAVPGDRIDNSSTFEYGSEEGVQIYAFFTATSEDEVWEYLARSDDELFFNVICPEGNHPAEDILDELDFELDEDVCCLSIEGEMEKEMLRVARRMYPTGELLKKYTELEASFYVIKLKPIDKPPRFVTLSINFGEQKYASDKLIYTE